MGEGERPFAEAFDDHRIERAVAGEVDGRIEPVGGETGAGADAESLCVACHEVCPARRSMLHSPAMDGVALHRAEDQVLDGKADEDHG